MTLQHISTPFDTHKRYGTFNIPIRSRTEFVNLAKRVVRVSDYLFNQAKPFMGNNPSSCLTLPRRCTLNNLLESPEKGLQIVLEGTRIWLGFIPFYDSSVGSEQIEPRGRKAFTHYRLGDFSKTTGRIVCKQNNVSLFSLPSIFHNEKTQYQFSSINHFSLLLLFDSAEKNGALVCCHDSLPAVSFFPILCLRQINSIVQDILPTPTESVAIPFLVAQHNGFVNIPVWSLDHWNTEIKKRFVKNIFLRNEEIVLNRDVFIFFPCGVSCDRNSGIQGMNFAFIKNGPFLQIAFFPKRKSNKVKGYQVRQYMSYFMEVFLCRKKNYYLSGCMISWISLAKDTFFVRNSNSNSLELRGSSLFFISSEDGNTCSLCYKKGDLELKCRRPTDSEGETFPIERLLEQSSAAEPSEKKARREEEQGETSQKAMEESKKVVQAKKRKASRPEEEQGETSQKAMEESKKVVQAKKRKASRPEEEQGETSQKAMEESKKVVQAKRRKASTPEEEQGETSQKAMKKSRIAVEARREEDDRRKCAKALVLLKQKKQQE